ncbi:MAG: Hpt domain-containing protein [Bacteroidales bacterium]|jgi:HPt (histidine-containing phosphotransfer) domain-containing protein|nr:Hpt domain-containing protein [Bacteroidales bacterium]
MVTDLKYLQQMTGDSAEIMKEMIDMFLAQLTETSVELESLYESGNWLELSRLAHKIKSSALVMGAEQLAHNMVELEGWAKAEVPQTEKCKNAIKAFHTLSVEVRKELEEHLKNL